MTRFRIIVRSLTGAILTYTVKEYTIEGNFVHFTDERTQERKIYHGSNCEIRPFEDTP